MKPSSKKETKRNIAGQKVRKASAQNRSQSEVQPGSKVTARDFEREGIKQRPRLLQELLDSEKDKLQDLVDGLARAVISIDIVDTDYRIRFQNQTSTNRFGDSDASLCYRRYMGRDEPWIALALCAAVLLGWAMGHLVRNRPAYAETFAPDWLPLAAAGLAAAGLVRLYGYPRLLRLQRALSWSGLLLMVWAANGLSLDLLRIADLIPSRVDWPGLATRTLALATAVVLAYLALAGPRDPSSTSEVRPTRVVSWYGYAAFVLALPYPVLRTWWALGGTLGLMWPGAAGHGFALWLASIPWLLAAALSLLLVPTWRWMPRRLLLAAGWSPTAIVAMVGSAACWSLVTTLVGGGDTGLEGIATWVPGLFYGSWFLWAIAAGAATRSYQLRSAALRMSSPT